MRSLLLLAVAAGYAFLAFRMPETSARGYSEEEGRGATQVLRLIERAAILNRVEECASLSPLPLYPGAPSPDEWRALCEAEILRERDRCIAIDGMLTPDLRTFCERSFVAFPS